MWLEARMRSNLEFTVLILPLLSNKGYPALFADGNYGIANAFDSGKLPCSPFYKQKRIN